MVEVLDNLNARFELVNFSLHQRLPRADQESQFVFNPTTLHDLLALFNMLFFAVLNDFPEFI